MPGATLNTFQHAASENPQQSTLVNTNGQEFSGTNDTFDGMNNNDSVLGIVMVNPPIDSIGETSIATSNYEPEFTQAGGAVVRVETKSGTNALHGSAFEFLQNNVFQGRDPFTQGLHDPGTPSPSNRGIPPLRWNQFGGSLGGPAIKDKLFWFADYQGTQRRLGASQALRVPTATERTGDLSDLGVPIFDPSSGNADGTGRVQFPGNVIPASRISQPAANLLGVLPTPNLTPANPADNNYTTSAVEKFDTNQFDIRVDHYLTNKFRYFGRYSYLGADINAPGPFGLYGGPQFSAWGFTGASNARNQNFVGAGELTLSPTLLADLRFGYSRYRVNVTPLDINQQLANTVGIPGLNFADRKDTWGLPDININGTGGFQMGYRCNCPLDQREFMYDGVANITKIHQNHTFKFGATYEFAGNRRLPSDDHRAGVYDFDPSITTLGPDTGGLGLASFLVGAPTQFRRFSQVSTTQEDRQDRMFYFVQDTWRVTQKLTLSYGLRWDTWFPDYSLNSGQGGRYDVTDNLVRIPGVGGIFEIRRFPNTMAQLRAAPRHSLRAQPEDGDPHRLWPQLLPGNVRMDLQQPGGRHLPVCRHPEPARHIDFRAGVPAHAGAASGRVPDDSVKRPAAAARRHRHRLYSGRPEDPLRRSVELHRRTAAAVERGVLGRLRRQHRSAPQRRL